MLEVRLGTNRIINHFSPSGVIAGSHGRVEVGSKSQVSRQQAYATSSPGPSQLNRHFENRRRESPGDEVKRSICQYNISIVNFQRDC